MAYLPKSANSILRDLRGMMLGRTELNDILAGSVMNTLLGAFSQEIASSERRLFNIRESFYFRGASGIDLDERVGELPDSGVRRLPATNASSSSLTIKRADINVALTIPKGSLVATESGLQYRTSMEVVIPQGEELIENVHVVALTAGANSNVLANNINTIIDLPDDVIEVFNTQPLSNGTDLESDGDLRERALIYVQSLSRCSPSTIRFLGQSFVSSTGERMKYVNIFEDVTKPAYCEVVCDDGSGLVIEGVSRQGATITGQIPSNGSNILFHQTPATAPITNQNIRLERGGVPIPLLPSQITSIPERGIVYVDENAIQAGDTFRISNYRVFQGFIKELQAEIEGDVSNPSTLTGFRAAGTRVVVTLATPQFVSFDISLLAEYNADYETIQQEVRKAVVDYINSLAPSEPLYTSALIDVGREVASVRDISIFTRNTNQYYPNQFPASPRVALRTNLTSVNFNNTPE